MDKERLIVLCLTGITFAAIAASLWLEFNGRTSPQWLGVLAGAAAGGILTLTPNGKGAVNGKAPNGQN